jgi:uncharacterized protein
MSALAVHQDQGTREDEPARLYDRLSGVIAGRGKLIVAFSGGADSALLAAVGARVLGDGCIAVTAVSPSLPVSELDGARRFARANGIRHLEVPTHEFDDPDYVANTGSRCYFCKSALFDALEPLADLFDAPMALGTNLDDLGEHRPGLAAAKLRGSIAPLVEAGLSKTDVRRLSAHLGLVTAEKPAAACLSSRVAYNEPVTAEVVGRIEKAEAGLHALGFDVCRVRSHGDGTVARIEVPTDRMTDALAVRESIDELTRSAGFTFASLDLAGFASGRMNALLPLSVRPTGAVSVAGR